MVSSQTDRNVKVTAVKASTFSLIGADVNRPQSLFYFVGIGIDCGSNDVNRPQSLFYFVPQESHSQAGLAKLMPLFLIGNSPTNIAIREKEVAFLFYTLELELLREVIP